MSMAAPKLALWKGALDPTICNRLNLLTSISITSPTASGALIVTSVALILVNVPETFPSVLVKN